MRLAIRSIFLPAAVVEPNNFAGIDFSVVIPPTTTFSAGSQNPYILIRITNEMAFTNGLNGVFSKEHELQTGNHLMEFRELYMIVTDAVVILQRYFLWVKG